MKQGREFGPEIQAALAKTRQAKTGQLVADMSSFLKKELRIFDPVPLYDLCGFTVKCNWPIELVAKKLQLAGITCQEKKEVDQNATEMVLPIFKPNGITSIKIVQNFNGVEDTIGFFAGEVILPA